MKQVDDAAILNRAKELCQHDGVAWDWFTVTAPGARVLSAKDRRERLMRARHELMREAAETESWERETPIRAEHVEQAETPTTESATFWPKRRVA